MADLGSTTFSQTDASNGTGTMPSWLGSAAPSTLDDAGRALQGAVTREWNWRNYTLTAAGTADAKTLTYSVAPAAYYNGQRFSFIANTTNATTTPTLNVNGLGAVTIKKIVAGAQTALAVGDMASGAFVEVAYNLAGTCFVWVNATPQNVGPSDNPQFNTIELGNASDTTISRSAAGVIAVEGGNVPKENRANTFSALQTISSGGLAVSGGDALVTGTGGLGYGTGSGSTVTQITSKATTVTLNKSNGQITMNGAALAANTVVSMQVNNSFCAATDTVILTIVSGTATAGAYVFPVRIGAGAFVVDLKNISGGSLSEAIVFNFSIIKAVAA